MATGKEREVTLTMDGPRERTSEGELSVPLSLFSISLGKASLIEVVGDSLSETEAKNPVENQWRSRPPQLQDQNIGMR